MHAIGHCSYFHSPITMASQSTELDLDMSNLSCQEEDPITRNRELFKVLLLHKFPGCQVVNCNGNGKGEIGPYDFYIIFNILDTSKFESFVNHAWNYLGSNGFINKTSPFISDPHITFYIYPLFHQEQTITYCLGFSYQLD